MGYDNFLPFQRSVQKFDKPLPYARFCRRVADHVYSDPGQFSNKGRKIIDRMNERGKSLYGLSVFKEAGTDLDHSSVLAVASVRLKVDRNKPVSNFI